MQTAEPLTKNNNDSLIIVVTKGGRRGITINVIVDRNTKGLLFDAPRQPRPSPAGLDLDSTR